MKHILMAGAAVVLLAACSQQALIPGAPAPARHMAFFDWDKATITPQAAAAIKTAADEVRSGRNVRVEIIGHTDSSGQEPYNMGLSMRRAAAVRNELLRNGVDPQNIGSTSGRGETALLVKTGDGVREPQNRRAEIALVR